METEKGVRLKGEVGLAERATVRGPKFEVLDFRNFEPRTSNP